MPPARRRPRPRARRRRHPIAAVAALVVALALAAGGYAIFRQVAVTPFCTVVDGATSYTLTPSQARNAATIAVTAKRLGLPDHAVTVALATALQESKLANLPAGDLDSIGLFQQRPSQGWGTPAELADPVYAATAFFRALAKVPGWQALPVAVAAQDVQHSADGAAYGDWAEQARAIAVALTGEQPRAFACQFAPTPPTRLAALHTALTSQLGAASVAAAPAGVRGWVATDWLVAQASEYGLAAVAYDGQSWRASSGHWDASGAGGGPGVLADDGRWSTP